MELVFKKNFKKNAFKLIRGNIKLQEKNNSCIIDFDKNIFNSVYYRKSLKNIGENIHELEIGGDIRILIELIIIEDKCYFLNIGTHSSLNLVGNKKVKL